MRKKLTAGVLATLIALAGPISQKALSRPVAPEPPKPQYLIQVVCGLVVIGVGVIVVYEIHKTCKKLFDPKPANANTNDPPNQVESFTGPGTPQPVTFNGKGMALNDETVPCWDASSFGWVDPVSGLAITDAEQFTIQSSTDFRSWREEYSVNCWSSDGGVLMLYTKAGQPVLTNYLAFGATNYVPLDMGGFTAPKKFFRIAAQQ